MKRKKQKTSKNRGSDFYFIQDPSSPYLKMCRTKGEIILPNRKELKGKFVFLENTYNNSLSKKAFGTLIAIPISTSKSTKNQKNLYELGFIQQYDLDNDQYATIVLFRSPIQDISPKEEQLCNHLSISMIQNNSNMLTSAVLLNCVTKSTSQKRPYFLSNEFDDTISKDHNGYISSKNGPDTVIFSNGMYKNVSTVKVTLKLTERDTYVHKEKVNYGTERNKSTDVVVSNKLEFVKRRKTVGNWCDEKQPFHLPNMRYTFYVVHDETKDTLFNSKIPQEIRTSYMNTRTQNQFPRFDDFSTISNTEQSHNNISKSHYAMPFLLSKGKFGLITYEQYLENFYIHTKSKEKVTMTPELHDKILGSICQRQHSTIQYDTIIDTSDYPKGFKFRAVTFSEFKKLMQKEIIHPYKATSTNIHSTTNNNILKPTQIAYSEESQYVHNPFPKSKNQRQKLHFPGVVVSQWVECDDFNKTNITMSDVKELLNTYSNSGNLSCICSKSKGFNLCSCRSGSNISPESSFTECEHCKNSQSRKKRDRACGTTTLHKRSFLMARDLGKFPQACDHLVSDLVLKCSNDNSNTDDTQKMNLSQNGNRMRVVTCGNKFTLGYFNTKHKDTTDVKFTDETSVMSYLLSQSYQHPDELSCAANYISNFFNMFGGIGAPKTVSYRFLDERARAVTGTNNSMKQNDAEFHVYFFLDSYNVVVRVNHGVSQIFHAYTFHHRTAIPCCVIDNCVHYQHDELNVFAHGIAGCS